MQRYVYELTQELFVKKFVEEGCINARMDKRKMVRYDDMGTHATYPAKAAQQNEYLDFLRDVVPMPIPLSVAMQQRAERTESGQERSPEASPKGVGQTADSQEPESEVAADGDIEIPPSSGIGAEASEPVHGSWASPAPAASPSSSTPHPDASAAAAPREPDQSVPMDL